MFVLNSWHIMAAVIALLPNTLGLKCFKCGTTHECQMDPTNTSITCGNGRNEVCYEHRYGDIVLERDCHDCESCRSRDYKCVEEGKGDDFKILACFCMKDLCNKNLPNTLLPAKYNNNKDTITTGTATGGDPNNPNPNGGPNNNMLRSGSDLRAVFLSNLSEFIWLMAMFLNAVFYGCGYGPT